MSSIRNIEEEKVINLSSLVKNKSGIISSMTLLDSPLCHAKLFAVAEGESISEELYIGDMLYYVLEGEMAVSINGEDRLLAPGEIIRIKGSVPHEIKAITAFKMVQALIIEED